MNTINNSPYVQELSDERAESISGGVVNLEINERVSLERDIISNVNVTGRSAFAGADAIANGSSPATVEAFAITSSNANSISAQARSNIGTN